MIRENLTSGSRYALMGITPNGNFRFQRRTSTSSNTSTLKSGSSSVPDSWVRLVRTGDTFSAYKSTTGSNWTLVRTDTITMAANIYFGLAVASGSTTLNTVSSTNVVAFP
jgi:regulation of enolase protein 1 (concanavalin A-like superfamily)